MHLMPGFGLPDLLIRQIIVGRQNRETALFMSFSPASLNVYKDGVPRGMSTVIDTLSFKRGQITKAYFGFDPGSPSSG